MAFEAVNIMYLSTGLKTQTHRLKDMTKAEYLHFKLNGDIESLSMKETFLRLKDKSKDWQSELCDAGMLYTENLDLVFFDNDRGVQSQSIKYNKRASLLKNNVASQKLGFEVFGECILVSQSARPAQSAQQLRTRQLPPQWIAL